MLDADNICIAKSPSENSCDIQWHQLHPYGKQSAKDLFNLNSLVLYTNSRQFSQCLWGSVASAFWGFRCMMHIPNFVTATCSGCIWVTLTAFTKNFFILQWPKADLWRKLIHLHALGFLHFCKPSRNGYPSWSDTLAFGIWDRLPNQ